MNKMMDKISSLERPADPSLLQRVQKNKGAPGDRRRDHS